MAQDLLHTINEDAHRLSDHETLLRSKKGVIPDSEHQAWMSTIRDWDMFFAEEVNRGLLSAWVVGANDETLKSWQHRFDGWRTKINKWDEVSKKVPPAPSVAKIVEKHLPDLSAQDKGRTETRKQEEKQEQEKSIPKLFGMPVWLASLLGIGGIVATGYTISSVARITGK